jgi:hypothetical protein
VCVCVCVCRTLCVDPIFAWNDLEQGREDDYHALAKFWSAK